MGREDGAARRVLVVGCGMAGTRFVARLTALNPDVRITVLDGEHRSAYNRTLLTGVLAGHQRPDDIALPLPPGTDLRAGVRVVRRATRTVIDSTGTEHFYDVLVLATGSHPHHPWPRRRPAAGGEHHLHTLADVRNLTADCAGARTPAVIGGGLLGVETALALAARDLPVTLVHRGPHLLHPPPGHQGRNPAARCPGGRGHHSTDGNARVGFGRGPGGRRVLLGDGAGEGDTVGADLVVAACGTRPRVALARAAGLPVRAGVVVDDTLASVGDPRVYALGDCAEHRGVVHDTAVPAWQQADVLAERLSGHDRHARFTGARTLTRLIAGDVDLAVFGEAAIGVGAGVGGGARTDVLCVLDDRRRVYKKIITRDDHVVGGILLGDLSTVDTVRQAYEATEPLPPERLHLVSALGGDG